MLFGHLLLHKASYEVENKYVYKQYSFGGVSLIMEYIITMLIKVDLDATNSMIKL